VGLASERIPPPRLADLIGETRLSYDGPLQVARGFAGLCDRRGRARLI